MPPCRRRQTRWPLTPNGGGVMVSVHSTALPPWSRVPQGERIWAVPTVPRLPWNAASYFSGERPSGLTVAQSAALWFDGHQVGQGFLFIVCQIATGWVVEPLVTSPVAGLRVASIGAWLFSASKAPGLVG